MDLTLEQMFHIMDVLKEVHVWFRRRPSRAREGIPSDQRLIFEVDADLSAQLRLAARERDQPPQDLAADLLIQGLEHESLRAQAERVLASLTRREQEVARLAARGQTNQQIAETLVVSTETVKTHVRNVLGKFGVRSKVELRVLFLDLGIRWWDGTR
ncbi:MAG TPA: helix-turn-helix transcriptional regulator [Anaerolineales bacterium]|nr:helix-turn-helix transcriptional regulator [Anaerolineales bacterium]